MIPLRMLLASGEAVEAGTRKMLHKFPRHAEDFKLGIHQITLCWNLHELLEEGTVCLRQTSLKEVKAEVAQAEPHTAGTAVLEDGTSCPADVIVWCTGYRSTALDPLDSALRAKVEAALPLFEMTFVPDAPGLAVMGQNFSFFYMLEMQAQWIAKVWAGHASLPTPQEMRMWVASAAAQQPAVKRPRKWMLPEFPGAAAIRIAKHMGAWPGEAWAQEHQNMLFEPRQLYLPQHK